MDIDRRKPMLVTVGIVTQQEHLLVPDYRTGLGTSPNEGDKFRAEMSDTFWSAPLWWHLPTCSLVMFFFGRDSITCGRAGGVPSFAISGWALKNCKEEKYLLKTMFNRHPYFKLGTEEKKEASEKIRVINCLFHDFLLASKHQGSVIFKRGLT